MGYLIMPEPGTEYGPCDEPCEHPDCAATRADAEKVCAHCGEPIGYGVKFTRDESGLEHWVCALRAMEHQRANQ